MNVCGLETKSWNRIKRYLPSRNAHCQRQILENHSEKKRDKHCLNRERVFLLHAHCRMNVESAMVFCGWWPPKRMRARGDGGLVYPQHHHNQTRTQTSTIIDIRR